MLFCRYDPVTPTKRNHLGILEPNTGVSSQAPAWTLDAVIVPLLAFDDEGFRLGWGGGFYDHTFAFTRQYPNQPRPWLIGIAYEFQHMETLPHAAHDVRLDLVVTDHRVLELSN
jgi:5-formyltetrahydrofolate cyclo-ligase